MADVSIPVAEMTEAQYEAFVLQMQILAHEEFGLWEVPLGSIDWLGETRRVVHGPWNGLDCSRVLLIWVRSGLLGVFVMAWAKPDTMRDLDLDEAVAVLSSPDDWTIERGAYLVRTDLGVATPWQRRVELAPRPTA